MRIFNASFRGRQIASSCRPAGLSTMKKMPLYIGPWSNGWSTNRRRTPTACGLSRDSRSLQWKSRS